MGSPMLDAEKDHKVINVPPDFCKMGQAVVPFDIVGVCSDQLNGYSGDTFARGDTQNVAIMGCQVRGTKGNQGAGVLSGTAGPTGHQTAIDGHPMILVNNAPATHHLARFDVNNANTQGRGYALSEGAVAAAHMKAMDDAMDKLRADLKAAKAAQAQLADANKEAVEANKMMRECIEKANRMAKLAGYSTKFTGMFLSVAGIGVSAPVAVAATVANTVMPFFADNQGIDNQSQNILGVVRSAPETLENVAKIAPTLASKVGIAGMEKAAEGVAGASLKGFAPANLIVDSFNFVRNPVEGFEAETPDIFDMNTIGALEDKLTDFNGTAAGWWGTVLPTDPALWLKAGVGMPLSPEEIQNAAKIGPSFDEIHKAGAAMRKAYLDQGKATQALAAALKAFDADAKAAGGLIVKAKGG